MLYREFRCSSKAITSPLNSSTDFCHGRSTDSRNHRKYSSSDLPTKSPWSMCISLTKDMYLRRWEANSSFFFLNANTCEHQKCICPLINRKRCFDFEVCCRLITPGETEMVTGFFSWCDNKHLLSIYLFERIFLFHFDRNWCTKRNPIWLSSNTLLIKSDTVEDVPCTDTAEVADSWDWSLWGMVALTT